MCVDKNVSSRVSEDLGSSGKLTAVTSTIDVNADFPNIQCLTTVVFLLFFYQTVKFFFLLRNPTRFFRLTHQTSMFRLRGPQCPKKLTMEIQNSGTKIAVIGKFVMINCAIIVIGNRLTSTENVLQTKLHVEITYAIVRLP